MAAQRTGTKRRKKKDDSDDGMESDRSGTRDKARKSAEVKSKRKADTSSEEEDDDDDAPSSNWGTKTRRTKQTTRRRRVEKRNPLALHHHLHPLILIAPLQIAVELTRTNAVPNQTHRCRDRKWVTASGNYKGCRVQGPWVQRWRKMMTMLL
jgi:hypothetical protein